MDTPNQYMMIPRLDFKNFVSWRCRILSVLEAKNLDSLLREEEPTSAEAKILFKKRDAECRGLLLCTINDEIVSLLLTCKSSREIWNSLTSRFESDLKKQSITARNDLHRIQMKETESLTDFLFRGEKMWQSTLILGSDVGEEEFLGALVKGILPKYNIIALQIATMEKPTIADVRRIFQIHQERNELKEKQEYSKAYHMDCRQNRNTNEYEEGCERRRNDRNRRIVCFTCQRAGHRQIDCWQNKKKENIREETKRLTQKFQKVKIAKDENPQVERKSEKTYFIRSSKLNEQIPKESVSLIKYSEDNRFEEKLSDKIQTTQKIFPEIQKMDNNCSEDMENILKEHLIEIEARLERKYSEELLSVKKEADERILKAEIQSNLKLKEFQEIFNEKLNQINFESEEKIKKAMEEKKIVQDEL